MNRQNDVPSTPEYFKTEALHSGERLASGILLAQRFRIEKQLGAGTQASVYAAYDELLGVNVALKIISGTGIDPIAMQSLRNEVVLARQLQHPNIIRVHDVFADDSHAFFTMEYIDGEPLFERLQRPINRTTFTRWQQQLFEAISACQAVNIKHGDIKPDNILIDSNDNLLLIDFGIGQSAQAGQQTSGHQDYTAPEVIQTGKACENSDTFSAGKVLQDMLACVALSSFSLSDSLWKKRQRKHIQQLTHPVAEQRPSVASALRLFNRSPYRHTGRIVSVIIASFFIGVLAIFINSPLQQDSPSLGDKPIQMLILSDPKYPLLGTISELLRYPLSPHPDIALIPAHTSDNIINNLALSPVKNDEHRVDLSAMLGADTVLMLDATPTSSTAYLVYARVLTMPANVPIFTVSHPVASQTLADDLDVFAEKLVSALFANLATAVPAPDLRYLSALETAWQQGKPFPREEAVAAMLNATPDYPGAWLAQAELALDENNLLGAREALQALNDIPNVGEYWRLQAELLRAQLNDDLPLALQAINTLVEKFPDRPDLLATRADIHQWNNDAPSAMADYRSALALRPNDGQLWFELARMQILNGNIELALSETLTKALVAFRNAKNKQGESLVLNAFGIANLRTANHEAAGAYFKEALALRNAETQPIERAKTLANLAISSSMMRDFGLAESSLKEALSLVQEQDDLQEEAHINDSLGFLYEESGRYREALEQYKRGLDIRVQIDNKALQPESMSNVAYMHFLIGDLSLAEIYWQQARTLFERINDKSHVLRTLQNLAQLSLVKGDNNAATRHLNTVNAQLTEQQEQERMYNHLLFSYLLFNEGNLDSAMSHNDKALQLANQTSDTRAFIEVSLWRGEMCLQTANWPCLSKALDDIASLISPNSHEQLATYKWLNLALEHHSGGNLSDSNETYTSLVDSSNIPVVSQLTILLDIQQRFDLPIDSMSMKKINALVKPTYNQPYLTWLYIKAKSGDESAGNKLAQKLAVNPDFWRNHMFYSVLPGYEEKQQQLTQAWLNQLPETQAQQYRQAYLE